MAMCQLGYKPSSEPLMAWFGATFDLNMALDLNKALNLNGLVSCYIMLLRRLVSKHHQLMVLRYKMIVTV